MTKLLLVTILTVILAITGTASSRKLIRHDGVTEFDIRTFMTDSTGGTIAVSVMGYQPPVAPMSLTEMLQAVADPDFAPPDMWGTYCPIAPSRG